MAAVTKVDGPEGTNENLVRRRGRGYPPNCSMWGALVFLLFFLVIGPDSREAILRMAEEARLRVAVAAPLSYFLLVVLGGSALVSALIMRFWPRAEDQRPPLQVLRRYQGHAEAEVIQATRYPAFRPEHAVEARWLIWPIRARLRCLKLARGVGGFAWLKRLAGV